MNIRKVVNDGSNLRDNNTIITFITSCGYRTPNYIWVGYSNDNVELYDITKKGCISAIERDNRLSKAGVFTK